MLCASTGVGMQVAERLQRLVVQLILLFRTKTRKKLRMAHIAKISLTSFFRLRGAIFAWLLEAWNDQRRLLLRWRLGNLALGGLFDLLG